MALSITDLKQQIDQVVIAGKELTGQEQNELLSNSYYSVLTYYLMKHSNNEQVYFANLKAQLKAIIYQGVSISNPDRNALLNEIYVKALGYFNEIVQINRAARVVPGEATSGEAHTHIGKVKDNLLYSSFFSISFYNYYLND